MRGDELGEVVSGPVGGLRDLRAAAKPVGEHRGGRGGGANRGKQDLQFIQNDPRFHDCMPGLRIEAEQAVVVPGEVQHDARADRLP